MGGSSSQQHHEDRPELTHAIQDDNLEWMTGLLLRNPELIKAKLDADGSNALHMAVLSRHHHSLAHLLTYVTNISRCGPCIQ